MATNIVVGRSGGKNIVVTLLDPQEKRQKFFAELQNGVSITNDGVVKVDNNGKPIKLKKNQRAWRAGWIACQNEAGKIFKKKHPNYKSKRK